MRKNNVKNNIEEILKNNNQGIKLDLGCGENKQPGFVGMDNRNLQGVDMVHDVEKFPFPLPDECASLVIASHLIEHINPHGGVFMNLMDEVWRIMKPDGEFMIAVPYAGSPGFWQDPTHCNGCNEVTWEYFDPISPVTKGALYRIYKPKPWKIKYNTWNDTGNLEVVMIKRIQDKSYDK